MNEKKLQPTDYGPGEAELIDYPCGPGIARARATFTPPDEVVQEPVRLKILNGASVLYDLTMYLESSSGSTKTYICNVPMLSPGTYTYQVCINFVTTTTETDTQVVVCSHSHGSSVKQ
jgi:hypothetical protein